MSTASRRRVVVVGGGFAGLQVVRGLRGADVDVTLVDRENYSLFQPLVYQVATGALSPAEIAAPLRGVVKRQRNARVVLAEVTDVDLDRREVTLTGLPNGVETTVLPFDTLVAAGGSQYSYFGHDEWRQYAPQPKSLDGALEIRTRILRAFEAAEVEQDPKRRAAWLTFVVVGGGPTGVEMAGQIAELARDTLRRDFRSVDTRTARVLLVEAAPHLLSGFPASLSARAARSLVRLGVTPLVDRTAVEIGPESVSLRDPSGTVTPVAARTVIWAAGVTAAGLASVLARAAGVEVDRAGRIPVGPDLSVAGHPDVLALGDMASVHRANGSPLGLPGLAPVAIQQGRYAARAIRTRVEGGEPEPFHYRDKGNLATIGRFAAVADIKGLHLSGFVAWVTWLVVHLFYLIGFQNRAVVLLRWTISFITHGRGDRLIGERGSGRD
jgi:NADH:ubiquinone reductase (H+-translocating)